MQRFVASLLQAWHGITVHDPLNVAARFCYRRPMPTIRADVAVIGGGIAGVTAASQLISTHSVVLLEQESELAFHTTSRSAAIFVENEGGAIFQRLGAASRAFLDDPPGADAPILEPLPVLSIGDASMVEDFTAEVTRAKEVTPSIRWVAGAELTELCPALRPNRVAVGMLEPNAASIDVMGLHQLYLRTARRGGADVRRSATVTAMSRLNDSWILKTRAGRVEAEFVVNAAGAWGDVVGAMAGAQALGLVPNRRTAFTSPIAVDASDWPFIYSRIPDVECYFKPEAGGQLLCSLADETPSEPCDARVEEIDVALAIERINSLTTLELRSVRTSWAGLRTFAPDRNPVFGWDDKLDNFMWLVGQGGCGIISSPAAGQIAAALIRGDPLPQPMLDLGLTTASLAPRR